MPKILHRVLKIIDGELHKYCSKCKDWWPATPEFYYKSAKMQGGLHNWCRACIHDRRVERKRINGYWDDGRQHANL